MDPNACLAIILDFSPANRREGREACENLRCWLENGGFAPRFTSEMAPKSRYGECRYFRVDSRYAIMTKHPCNDSEGWIFLQYGPEGNVYQSWELSR